MFSNNFLAILFFNQAAATSIQIKSTSLSDPDNELCLSYDEINTAAGYNPEILAFSVYPTIIWESCKNITVSNNNNNDVNNQLFKFNQYDQLVHINPITGQESCVTPLAVGNSHSNLDPCDTWTNFDGAGTYLFAIECAVSEPDYQKFSYNSANQIFSSKCSHNFKLGRVLTRHGESKSFLTDDFDSFDSSEVLEINDDSHKMIIDTQSGEIIIPIGSSIQISQPKSKAYMEIVSQFLTTNQFTEISQHGCWCSKIFGTNQYFAGNAVDTLDQLCKEWAQTRRCNDLTGASCGNDDIYGRNNLLSYTMVLIGGSDQQIDCEKDEFGGAQTDNCLKDSCLIDTMYASSVAQFLAINNSWSKIVQTGAQCPQGLASTVDKVCNGVAPSLQIDVL